MTIKDIRINTNMTQKDFAEYFNIPVRTLQDWEYEKRTPPVYVIELIKYKAEKERLVMETMFNQENLVILIKENGGDVDYGYGYFKEGFEEWARDLKMNLPDVGELKQYLRECGYNVIEIEEL